MLKKNLIKTICGLVISFSLLATIVHAQVSIALGPSVSTVFAGEDSSISITLKNDGTKALSNVLFNIDIPDALGGNRQFTVGSIPAGSTYSKTLEIITFNATARGNYSVSGNVSYSGETIDFPNATVHVADFPISIDYHYTNERISAGEEDTLIVGIGNEWNGTVTDLNVSIDYPAGFITNMSRTLLLPQIMPGLTLQQQFTFVAPATANGDYHLGISIRFKADGISHTVQKYATLNVAGTGSFGWLETLLLVIIIILIALLLLGRAK